MLAVSDGVSRSRELCLVLTRQPGLQVKPSVLHGDLWSGNISGVDGAPSIFDPAVYYGHSEAEFGMSWCAGFSSAFYNAYHKVLPKAPGGYSAVERRSNAAFLSTGQQRPAMCLTAEAKLRQPSLRVELLWSELHIVSLKMAAMYFLTYVCDHHHAGVRLLMMPGAQAFFPSTSLIQLTSGIASMKRVWGEPQLSASVMQSQQH